MASVKKRKVDSECRVFKEEWTWKYMFTVYNEKPVCLICQETVAVFKDFNLARHFTTKHIHSKYTSMNKKERKSSAETLKKALTGQQSMFSKQNASQKASTLASYVVAHKIAKCNKPFSDGEFIKECLISVSNIVCPEKTKVFESVSLSRKTITTRTEEIGAQLSRQLKRKVEKFKYFSVALDESTDISDTAQLLIFVRGIDEEFNITEELASLQSLKGQTTGQIIYNAFSNCLSDMNAPIDKLCNVTTDGAPNMVGNKSGFMGIFSKENPDHDTVFLHCVIHQDVLCKAAIDIKHVHRQFQEFLKAEDAEYRDLLYHTKVRWLSCGNAFQRVWNLKNEIESFLKHHNKWEEFKIMKDEDWLAEFAFFTDLLQHFNALNTKLQGKNQFLDELWGHLKAFKIKLKLFSACIEKHDFSHFERLNTLPIKTEKTKEFVAALTRLHEQFENRFQDFKRLEISLDLFSMPFQVDPERAPSEIQLELIELQCSAQLKQAFSIQNKYDFYKSLPKESYPNIVQNAQKLMAMLASTYLCEQAFSKMKLNKSNLRSRLTDEHLFSTLKIACSQMSPNYEEIEKSRSQFHSSHTPTCSRE